MRGWCRGALIRPKLGGKEGLQHTVMCPVITGLPLHFLPKGSSFLFYLAQCSPLSPSSSPPLFPP